MSYLVARMQKMKSQNLGGIQRHNQREFENHSNKEIDVSRSHLNFDLFNHENIDYRDRIMNIIE
ncbi:TPA: plasmid recombination protein, partial [Salmonella enterica subsp. enterica serovar Dublin]